MSEDVVLRAPIQDELLHVLPLLGPRCGLRLVGALDLSCTDSFAAALAGFSASSTDVHLELAELRFIDVAGTRLLLQGAQRLHSETSSYLVLHHSSWILLRVLALFAGGDRIPIDKPIRLPLPSAVSRR